MTIYLVWSQHVEPTLEKVIELRRTDKRVALDDVSLIQSILHRKAWIEEVDSAFATISVSTSPVALMGGNRPE